MDRWGQFTSQGSPAPHFNATSLHHNSVQLVGEEFGRVFYKLRGNEGRGEGRVAAELGTPTPHTPYTKTLRGIHDTMDPSRGSSVCEVLVFKIQAPDPHTPRAHRPPLSPPSPPYKSP